METGEEGETTRFTCRAKLYAFHKDPKGDAAWKERGTGTLKLNTAEADGKPSVKKARLILRVDGTHNLVLNTPIFKEFQFNGVNSEKPKDGRILFTTFSQGENGVETTTMQLRVCWLPRFTPSFPLTHRRPKRRMRMTFGSWCES